MRREEDAMAASEGALGPDDISGRSFPTAFRGFDPVEVRAFLNRVADELRAMQVREEQLRRELEAAPKEVAPGDALAAIEEARERARALQMEANERARSTESDAAERAAKVVAEAREEADRVRREAETVAVARTAEAESLADKLRLDSDKEAAAIRVRAREDADAIIEQARQRGREMVSEAQAARERMLADLAKRKRAAAAQMDQIKAGRDRLLEHLKHARRSIDEVTVRFEVADPSGTLRTSSSMAPPSSMSSQPTSPSLPPGVPSPAPQRPGSASTVQPPAGGRPPQRPALPSRRDDKSETPVIDTTPTAPIPVTAAPSPSGPAAPAPAEFEPPKTEERRSSALRILRRARPTQPPPQLEELEGVRILPRTGTEAGPPDMRAPVPEPEPEHVAATAAVEAEAEVEVEPATDTSEPEVREIAEVAARLAADEPAESSTAKSADIVAPTAAATSTTPGPKVDDLFARLRAERESADVEEPEPEPEPEKDQSAAASATPAANATEQVSPAAPAPEAPLADSDEAQLQRRDAVVEPLVGQLTRRVKRALQDEQNDALDRLRTNRGPLSIDAVLPPAQQQSSPYVEAASRFLEEAARSAAAASPFGATAVGVGDFATQLAADIAGTLRSRLASVIDAASAEGLELSAVSDRISSVYREWKGQRVERVVVHHVVAAWSRGAFIGTPEGTPQRWVVDDEAPCPDCDDNALAGPTPRGTPFPTGQLHPPAHVGCRCLLVLDRS